jgi:hypothetical protein
MSNENEERTVAKAETVVLSDNWIEYVELQIQDIDPEATGILIIKFGKENYVVSGRVGQKIGKAIKDFLKERFPNLEIVIIPFYVELEYLEIDKKVNFTIEGKEVKTKNDN